MFGCFGKKKRPSPSPHQVEIISFFLNHFGRTASSQYKSREYKNRGRYPVKP